MLHQLSHTVLPEKGCAEGEAGLEFLLPQMILTLQDRMEKCTQGTFSLSLCHESTHTSQTNEFMLFENSHAFEKTIWQVLLQTETKDFLEGNTDPDLGSCSHTNLGQTCQTG